MLILRTSLATLLVVALAGLAYGQKCGAAPACGPCKIACSDIDCGGKCGAPGLGITLKSCGGKAQSCEVEHGSASYFRNSYMCECQTVCLPRRTLTPGAACGLGKGCGGCGECGACEPCKSSPCQTDACQSCQGGKSADGGGKLGGLLTNWTCKPRVKKHLMVQQVEACEVPTVTCVAGGKGKGKDGGPDAVPALIPLEGEEGAPLEAEPEVPEPPPINVGRFRRVNPVPNRSSGRGLIDILLR